MQMNCWSPSHTGQFTAGERATGNHLIEGRTADMHVVAKTKIPAPTENSTPVVQLTACHYNILFK
jgi:hypothetical protein